MKPSLEAFYLPATAGQSGPPGQRFCLLHVPACVPAKGAVLHVQPFAEEMNKLRRMAALQSRALAEAGFAVLQVDLHGCGDSSGDFGEATWEGWVEDMVQAARWLSDRHPAPLWFWGLRAGCLIAAQAAARLDRKVDFLFQQPVAAGKVHLQQFLRLKVAGEMIGGRGKGVMEAMKASLAAGAPVEVAGYLLSADVATGLEAATLEPPPDTGRVVWLEVSSQAEAGLAPASERVVAGWRERGLAVDARVVAGPPFWQTTEIETAPALVEASLAAMAARTDASAVAAVAVAVSA